MPDTWQIFKACYWQFKAERRRNSSVVEPSYGTTQPGYRLPRPRVRIPGGHRLVSVVNVPYSDSFGGIVAGDISIVFFALELQLVIECQVSSIADQI